MDIVKRENVNVNNAVLVSGITLSESDDDLEQWLLRYGSIKRTLLIDSPTSEFHRHAIIEFQYSSAMDELQTLLPLRIVGASKADVTFNVQALSSVYPQVAGSDVTKECMDELQEIAKASGRSFHDVIQELRKLGSACNEPTSRPSESNVHRIVADSQPHRSLPKIQQAVEHTATTPLIDRASVSSVEQSKYQNLTKTNDQAGAVPVHTTLPVDVMGPPGIQRVVVEHIVRATDAVSNQYVPMRLRSFSGKSPRPANEPDFETWRASVDFLLDDPSISDLSRTRKILDSLLPPAADVVKHIGSHASPLMYLGLLESVYGSVEDGDELLARYMTLLQNQGEKPSSYLHRLQVMLSATVRRGGISEAERNHYLLRQFCRGCWDSNLLVSLNLEKRKNEPPSFAELVVAVRTEEDKQASKEERMRSHLGMTKPGLHSFKSRATVHQLSSNATEVGAGAAADVDPVKKQISEIHAQLVPLKSRVHKQGQTDSQETAGISMLREEINELRAQVKAIGSAMTKKNTHLDSDVSELADLRKQVAELKAQLAITGAQKNQTQKLLGSHGNFKKPQPKQTELNKRGQSNLSDVVSARPRPGYCFNCGHTEIGSQLECPNQFRKPFDFQWKDKISGRLPKGLIGTKCTAQLCIEGTEVNCLLDTGSQVTTIPLSFHNAHLSDFPVKPLDALLEVEGANGQSVPYLGYVELTLTFPKEFLGVTANIDTLALVVPDLKGVQQILMGTNSLDALYDVHAQGDLELNPAFNGYRAVLKILSARHKQRCAEVLGHVTLRGDNPEIVPAGRTVVFDGVVQLNHCLIEDLAVIDSTEMSNLPGGLVVASSLHALPGKRSFSVPLLVKNETQVDINISPKTVLANVCSVQKVTDISQRSDFSQAQEQSNEPQINIDFGDSTLPTEWKCRITALLNTMPEVFALHDMDYGHTDRVKHHIKLSNETPFKQRPRPIHPQDVSAVRKHLQELLDAGIIRESESPFASPIVVVRKKDNSVRLCIDFRKLNAQTIKDAYALPNLEEAFSVLTGSKWFSVLDLKSGYYQIEMNEQDKAKTAFVCPIGFWEFNRMPQGITNAPSTFQRLMERCMGSLNRSEVLVFIDDLIVFSDTLEEHERRLIKVLNRLKEYGLKLSPEKCSFFQTSVRYLGHIVSQHGVSTDPSKIEAVKTWPKPQTLKELKSFLGFAGYYRRFVKDFSKIVRPLNDLTAGYPPVRKNAKCREVKQTYLNPRDPLGQRWTNECQRAFDTIVDKLTTAPILGYADPRLPYLLHTDASTIGLGAALYQEQEGQLRVIAYASRGLTRSEARYPAHKLEFLALKWAVTSKFSDYLYGSEFTVVTDSNPLTYILTSAKLDAASYRWLSSLSTYNFKIQYRAGTQNMDADGLSRRPNGPLRDDVESQKEQERIKQFTLNHLGGEQGPQVILPEVVKAICERHQIQTSPVVLAESLGVSANSLPQAFLDECDHGLPAIPTLSEDDLACRQRADSEIREIIDLLEANKRPPSMKNVSMEMALWFREWSKFEIRRGLLYRKRIDQGRVRRQLALPKDLRELVLTSLHDDMGHLGVERTLDLLRARFYWPRMASAVEKKISTCERCVRRKAPVQKAAPLVNIQTSRPLELLCMDFLSVEPDSSNTKDILVITDHFTKYAVAIPTRNQKAQTVAKCLWEHFLVHYGFPEKLHSDQGPDFESRLIQELCKIAGIRKVRTTPYHPRGNPVERFNRTLLQMLGTLENKQKAHWKDYVKPMVHAYNCTRNDVTGYSPYELMFGRQPRLPLDIAFGILNDEPQQSHSQYVTSLKQRLEESYKLAVENSKKVAERNKKRFDKNVVNSVLEVGDRVLVKNVRLRGKHKLADKWETDIYVVLSKVRDIPVYTVCPEGKNGPVRTLHRDLLLPCGFLPRVEATETASHKVRHRRRTRAQSGVENDNEAECSNDGENSESEHSYCVMPRKSLDLVSHLVSNENSSQQIDSQLIVPSTIEVDVADAAQPNTDYLEREVQEVTEKQKQLCDKANENIPVRSVEDEPGEGRMENPVAVSWEEDCNNSELIDQSEILESVDLNPAKDSDLDQSKGNSPTCEAVPDDMVSRKGNSQEEGVRHSTRVTKPPKKFHYPQLGNPLISVVQSLLQGLSTAFAQAENNSDIIQNQCVMEPGDPLAAVTMQPHACTRTCMRTRGEGVTPVTKVIKI
nr:uncharacterized protein LOC129454170 [Misgurnus anguillicaudatus]